MSFIPPTLRGTILGFLVLVPLLYIVPLVLIGRWNWETAELITRPIKAAQIWIVSSIVVWPLTILPTAMAALSFFLLARYILNRFGDRIRTRLRLVLTYVLASGICCAAAIAIVIVVVSSAASPREPRALAATALGWASVSFTTGAIIGAIFGLSAIVAPNKRLQPVGREDAPCG